MFAYSMQCSYANSQKAVDNLLRLQQVLYMMHRMVVKSTSPPKLELALRFSIGDSWLEYTLAKEYASVHSNATDS